MLPCPHSKTVYNLSPVFPRSSLVLCVRGRHFSLRYTSGFGLGPIRRKTVGFLYRSKATGLYHVKLTADSLLPSRTRMCGALPFRPYTLLWSDARVPYTARRLDYVGHAVAQLVEAQVRAPMMLLEFFIH